jgi:hypothetical protein
LTFRDRVVLHPHSSIPQSTLDVLHKDPIELVLEYIVIVDLDVLDSDVLDRDGIHLGAVDFVIEDADGQVSLGDVRVVRVLDPDCVFLALDYAVA